MSIRVLKLRGSCHLQDTGRLGQGFAGLPVGGFADVKSAALANLLVGNKHAASVLECTLGGPDFYFDSACDIAITGAALQVKIDGVPVSLWQRIHVPAGSTLTTSHARNGLRSYIAFDRSILAPSWRGSVSPVLLGDVLHPKTSVLSVGDELPLGELNYVKNLRVHKAYVHVPAHLRALADDASISLNVYEAPESSFILSDEGARKAFQHARWQVSAQSNRMGIRLVGPSLPLGKTSGLMRSGPVIPGTVQLLPDGQLIITHVDSQTIGGYPRIGVVDAFGMAVLAQAGLGKIMLKFTGV